MSNVICVCVYVEGMLLSRQLENNPVPLIPPLLALSLSLLGLNSGMSSNWKKLLAGQDKKKKKKTPGTKKAGQIKTQKKKPQQQHPSKRRRKEAKKEAAVEIPVIPDPKPLPSTQDTSLFLEPSHADFQTVLETSYPGFELLSREDTMTDKDHAVVQQALEVSIFRR